MRFRRPSVRYSTTPPPATPYQSAQQLWDERIGGARVQALNWRRMAFGCLILSGFIAGGLLAQLGRSTITPYVVEVDRLGAVRAVAPATETYGPAAQLTTWSSSFVAFAPGPSTRSSFATTGWVPTTRSRTAARLRSTTTPEPTTPSPGRANVRSRRGHQCPGLGELVSGALDRARVCQRGPATTGAGRPFSPCCSAHRDEQRLRQNP